MSVKDKLTVPISIEGQRNIMKLMQLLSRLLEREITLDWWNKEILIEGWTKISDKTEEIEAARCKT